MRQPCSGPVMSTAWLVAVGPVVLWILILAPDCSRIVLTVAPFGPMIRPATPRGTWQVTVCSPLRGDALLSGPASLAMISLIIASAAATCSSEPDRLSSWNNWPGSPVRSFPILILAPVDSRTRRTFWPPGPMTLAAMASGSMWETSEAGGASGVLGGSDGRCRASLTKDIAAATCSSVPPTVSVWVSTPGIFSFEILMYAPDDSRMFLMVAPPCPITLPADSLSSSCLCSARGAPSAASPCPPRSGVASSLSTSAMAAWISASVPE
mmetsp:Transcript_30573/g.98871  ORF Transcript_30573/g.98871 Transcript_30573/m.98871 type:complete len:267 (+) Transcript_30573:1483-2283(+)